MGKIIYTDEILKRNKNSQYLISQLFMLYSKTKNQLKNNHCYWYNIMY